MSVFEHAGRLPGEEGIPLANELKHEDMVWQTNGKIAAQSKTFYCFFDNGGFGILQIVYSDIKIKIVVQVSATLILGSKNIVASENYGSGDFVPDPDMQNVTVYKKHFIRALDPTAAKGYKVCIAHKELTYNLDVEFLDRGYKVRNGKSYLGKDRADWVSHRFFPLCKVSGSYATKGDAAPSPLSGTALYVEAVSSISPQATANSWDFLNLQAAGGNSLSLIGFHAPAKFDKAEFYQGSLTLDGRLVAVAIDNVAQHTVTAKDPQSGYDVPTECLFVLEGQTIPEGDAGGKPQGISITCKVPVGKPTAVIDILSALPWVIRVAIQALVAKPFLFQWLNTDVEAEIKFASGETRTIKGRSYVECTYVSS